MNKSDLWNECPNFRTTNYLSFQVCHVCMLTKPWTLIIKISKKLWVPINTTWQWQVMDPRFFPTLFHMTSALRAWTIKGREKTRSTTCRTDQANESNKRYVLFLILKKRVWDESTVSPCHFRLRQHGASDKWWPDILRVLRTGWNPRYLSSTEVNRRSDCYSDISLYNNFREEMSSASKAFESKKENNRSDSHFNPFCCFADRRSCSKIKKKRHDVFWKCILHIYYPKYHRFWGFRALLPARCGVPAAPWNVYRSFLCVQHFLFTEPVVGETWGWNPTQQSFGSVSIETKD